MSELYTERARRVIFFARYEASQYGSPHIETEHLLLGLIREDRRLTNRFLGQHGSLESNRLEVESRVIVRQPISKSSELPLSVECKRILNFAADEAKRLGHTYIGTEHLLLGILREEKCLGAQILGKRGLSLASAREELAHQSEASGTLKALAPDASDKRGDGDLEAAHETLFRRRPFGFEYADRRPPRMRPDERGPRFFLGELNLPPFLPTRIEELSLPIADVPALTITADPCNKILLGGSDRSDWFIRFCAQAEGDSEREAEERLQQVSMQHLGGTVSINGPVVNARPRVRGSMVVDGPAGSPVVIHASFSPVEVRDVAGTLRIAASHARAKIMDTTGQVDVNASVIDFAGSQGRISLSAQSGINLKMTAQRFEGTLLAWAQRPLRMLVPTGFMTPFQAMVNRPQDFVCRTDFCSKVKEERKNGLFVFTYDGDGSTAPEGVHLRSEQATVVIDTSDATGDRLP